jgi:hypothetical protein
MLFIICIHIDMNLIIGSTGLSFISYKTYNSTISPYMLFIICIHMDMNLIIGSTALSFISYKTLLLMMLICSPKSWLRNLVHANFKNLGTTGRIL